MARLVMSRVEVRLGCRSARPSLYQRALPPLRKGTPAIVGSTTASKQPVERNFHLPHGPRSFAFVYDNAASSAGSSFPV